MGIHLPLSGGGKLILHRSSPGMSHRREHFLLQLGRFRCSGASRSNSKNQFARLPSSAAVSGYASVRPLPPSGLAWIVLTGRYWSSEESAMPRSTCTTGWSTERRRRERVQDRALKSRLLINVTLLAVCRCQLFGGVREKPLQSLAARRDGSAHRRAAFFLLN